MAPLYFSSSVLDLLSAKGYPKLSCEYTIKKVLGRGASTIACLVDYSDGSAGEEIKDIPVNGLQRYVADAYYNVGDYHFLAEEMEVSEQFMNDALVIYEVDRMSLHHILPYFAEMHAANVCQHVLQTDRIASQIVLMHKKSKPLRSFSGIAEVFA